jgi:hypothetical protein
VLAHLVCVGQWREHCAGPDRQLFEDHPAIYFVSVGLKYGPARSLLATAAAEAGLMPGEMSGPKLRAVLHNTAAKLHQVQMTEWDRAPMFRTIWGVGAGEGFARRCACMRARSFRPCAAATTRDFGHRSFVACLWLPLRVRTSDTGSNIIKDP